MRFLIANSSIRIINLLVVVVCVDISFSRQQIKQKVIQKCSAEQNDESIDEAKKKITASQHNSNGEQEQMPRLKY